MNLLGVVFLARTSFQWAKSRKKTDLPASTFFTWDKSFWCLVQQACILKKERSWCVIICFWRNCQMHHPWVTYNLHPWPTLVIWYCPFVSTATIINDGKRQPLCELKLIPADSSSIECTYDIWQKRDPPLNRSFRKGKNKGADGNVLNYETTI